MKIRVKSQGRGSAVAVGAVALWLCAVASVPAQFTNVVNLTTTTFDGNAVDTTLIGNVTVTGSFIGDAFFRFGPGNSGSGQYRKMYGMSDTSVSTNPVDSSEGYNRPNVMDVGNLSINSWAYDLHMSNLVADASGQYYVFALDINQNNKDGYLSLDDVQIYTGGTNDPSPLPQTRAELANLGTLRYAMNSSLTQSYVIMDADLTSGSGQQDLFLFVATSLFTGADASDHVYLYSSFGTYSLYDPTRTDTTPNDGFEEWALPTSFDVEVPEPPAVAFGALGLVGCLWFRRRFRR